MSDLEPDASILSILWFIFKCPKKYWDVLGTTLVHKQESLIYCRV